MKLHPDQMGHTHVVKDFIPAPQHLCDRHMQIWRQLVIGGSNKEIAQRIGLRPHTVQNHLYELYAVLELNPERSRGRHSRTTATLWGMDIMRHHPEAFREGEKV